MKFKKNIEPIYTSEFWYDLTDGGDISPKLILEEDDAKRVIDAIRIIKEFEEKATELGIINEY